MFERYQNTQKYEEVSNCTGANVRRFVSKDGKEQVEIRGMDIITVRKDDSGNIGVSWKRVTDAD